MRSTHIITLDVETDEPITGAMVADLLTGHGWDANPVGEDDGPAIPAGWIIGAEVTPDPHDECGLCEHERARHTHGPNSDECDCGCSYYRGAAA